MMFSRRGKTGPAFRRKHQPRQFLESLRARVDKASHAASHKDCPKSGILRTWAPRPTGGGWGCARCRVRPRSARWAGHQVCSRGSIAVFALHSRIAAYRPGRLARKRGGTSNEVAGRMPYSQSHAVPLAGPPTRPVKTAEATTRSVGLAPLYVGRGRNNLVAKNSYGALANKAFCAAARPFT